MTQLILDGFVLPESKKNGYKAILSSLYTDVEMISGRTVREFRGHIWEISYQYGFFSDEDKTKFISIVKNGISNPIRCGFLTPNSSNLNFSDFLVTDITYPKFFWSSNGIPMWGDFEIELKEVNPHD